MSEPFLTIITRCCQRPQLLRRCIQSVKAQTCQDIEQLFLVDERRRGLAWANRQFDVHKDKPGGGYIYLLDDDGRLADPRFVGQVRQMATQADRPDLILVKSLQTNLDRVLPPDEIWNLDWRRGERPARWVGSGYTFVVRSEVWRANAWRYHAGQGETWHTGGDWQFMTGMIGIDVNAAKLDLVASIAERRRGRGFENVKKDWFGPVVRKYGLEHVGENVWRLSHNG